MKRTYEKPAIAMVEVKIEKGFATSQPSDTFGIQNFDYEDLTGQDANTAW